MLKNEFDDLTDSAVPKFLGMIQKKEIDKKNIDSMEALLLNQYEMLALSDMDAPDPEVIKGELIFLISRYRSENTDHLKADFARKIQLAEASGDKEKVKSLLQDFSNLIK